MNLRRACRQLQRVRDRMQWRLDAGRVPESQLSFVTEQIEAFDLVLGVAMHEADLLAIDAAKNRRLYGMQELPMAAP